MVLACSRATSGLLRSSLRWVGGHQAVEAFQLDQGLALSKKIINNSRSFKGWAKSYQKFRQLLHQFSRIKFGSGLR